MFTEKHKSLAELITFGDSSDNTLEISDIIANGLSYFVLKKIPKSHELYSPLHEFTKRQQIIYNFQLTEIRSILRKLNSSGIEVIILKGWALCDSVYSDGHSRPKTDIDILVQEGDKKKILNIFEDEGYQNFRGWYPKVIIDQFSLVKTLSKNIFVNFDIHFKITNDKLIQKKLQWTYINRLSYFSPFYGARCPKTSLLFIHACIHLLHHRTNGDSLKLIWFYDIYLISKKFKSDDYEEIKKYSDINGLTEVFTFSISLVQGFFYSEELSVLSREIELGRKDDNLKYMLKIGSSKKYILRNFMNTRGIGSKIIFVKETFFPPISELKNYDADCANKSLVYVYLYRIYNALFLSSKK